MGCLALTYHPRFELVKNSSAKTLTSKKTVLKSRSDYVFGFNGIHKENEIAGIGNHYSAFFGEYNPRTVWRWNLDPKPNSTMSPYSMFAGNPIRYSDILLDSIGISGFRQEKILKNLNRGLLVDRNKSPYSFNGTGKLIVDEDKYNALSDKQKEIASPIKDLARSDMDVKIVKARCDTIFRRETLGNYGGAATIANLDATGNQDMSGKSGVTILWTGKGESFSPSYGAPMIYQTDYLNEIFKELSDLTTMFL